MKSPIRKQFPQATVNQFSLNHVGWQKGEADSLNGRLLNYVEEWCDPRNEFLGKAHRQSTAKLATDFCELHFGSS
ncbi:hypothetical protein CBM2633_U30005 [Cupriavidus taiwanensis]|nr:hypothetical protein CBM2633_U30005 [Cupriavidus taiwanensis]